MIFMAFGLLKSLRGELPGRQYLSAGVTVDDETNGTPTGTREERS